MQSSDDVSIVTRPPVFVDCTVGIADIVNMIQIFEAHLHVCTTEAFRPSPDEAVTA